jgi:hypothetical protein
MLDNNNILEAAGIHLNGRTAPVSRAETRSADDLIRHAKAHPPEPMIKGLVNKGDILLLHGSEECFKSVFVLQMAESLATGNPLLTCWNVPRAWRVGVIETEIHEVMLGERLHNMFPAGDPPGSLLFMAEGEIRNWRPLTLSKKFESIQKWTRDNGIEVLMVDTANDFFRGPDNPSDERNVGQFFDELRNVNIGGRFIVRHDRKKKANSNGHDNSNEQIRGSAEWKEDPEAIVSLARPDRRTHEVTLEVGKLRYGIKPEPMALWFDAKRFRLTALPPMIEVLSAGDSHSREDIVAQCRLRFGLAERKVADMIAEQGPFLEETQRGHSKAYAIDMNKVESAPWYRSLFGE